MTDITELAPAMKAAAEKASSGDWVKESGDGWDATCSNDDQANSGFIIANFIGPDSAANREFVQLANPANVKRLVEALEKAQQVDEELCKLLPPGAEYMDPPDGGDVEPIEQVRRMVADYRQRIAELESSTVTVKLPPKIERDYVDGWFSYKGGLVGGGAAEWYNKALDDVGSELTAAGIKWEAE